MKGSMWTEAVEMTAGRSREIVFSHWSLLFSSSLTIKLSLRSDTKNNNKNLVSGSLQSPSSAPLLPKMEDKLPYKLVLNWLLD